MRVSRPLAFCLPFLAASWLHAAPTLYDQGDPTNEEQYLLQKLNRARMDPAGEGQRLADWLRNTYVGQSIVKIYGTNPDQVAADFMALPAVPPLTFDAHLLAAARAHSADLAAHGLDGPGGDRHRGYDGSTQDSRAAAAGYTGETAGECGAAAAASLEEIHAGYLVDWGVPSLGHRKTEMQDGVANAVGLGLASAPGINGGYTMLVETEDYGKRAVGWNGTAATYDDSARLTGVVYHDTNSNGQYDVGEGVAGVTVTMDGGSYYTVTSASGGYALPLVNANGSSADGSVTAHVRFADDSEVSRVVTLTRHDTPPHSYSGDGSDPGPYHANVEWDVQTAAANALPTFFDGAATLMGGWNYLPFSNGNSFGYYNASAYPYLFHNDLGWLYVQDAQDGKAGVYLYDFASSAWWYTSLSYPFPYLYDFRLGTVLYYYPREGQPGFYTSSPRSFYNFATGQIVTL